MLVVFLLLLLFYFLLLANILSSQYHSPYKLQDMNGNEQSQHIFFLVISVTDVKSPMIILTELISTNCGNDHSLVCHIVTA